MKLVSTVWVSTSLSKSGYFDPVTGSKLSDTEIAGLKVHLVERLVK